MKYLKRYNLVLESSKILEDLDYLLLDIKDLGLNVDISKNNLMDNDISSYYILISNKGNYFPLSYDVKETIIRINQYLKERGYKTQYVTNFGIAVSTFIVRPDEKLRYLNGLWLEDNYNFINIKMYFWLEKKST